MKKIFELIVLVILIIVLVILSFFAYRLFAGKSNKSKIELGYEIQKETQDSIENVIVKVDLKEVESFNSQWSIYEGSQTGTQIQVLKQRVESHNSIYSDDINKQIELIIDGEIESRSTYNVELFFNADGYINKMEVKLDTNK